MSRLPRARRCLDCPHDDVVLTPTTTTAPGPCGPGAVSDERQGEPALRVSEGADGVRLRALGALGDLELDPLGLLEGLVSGGLDGGVVDEDVRATAVLGDEAEALL